MFEIQITETQIIRPFRFGHSVIRIFDSFWIFVI
jgi:hypothetical protein